MLDNIILIGFMGCGKTTFGTWIAKNKKMDFSLFFINYTFLTLFVVIISNRIMKYIHLLITMTFCYFFHVGLW